MRLLLQHCLLQLKLLLLGLFLLFCWQRLLFPLLTLLGLLVRIASCLSMARTKLQSRAGSRDRSFSQQCCMAASGPRRALVFVLHSADISFLTLWGFGIRACIHSLGMRCVPGCTGHLRQERVCARISSKPCFSPQASAQGTIWTPLTAAEMGSFFPLLKGHAKKASPYGRHPQSKESLWTGGLPQQHTHTHTHARTHRHTHTQTPHTHTHLVPSRKTMGRDIFAY